ncbi:MAG: YaiO family outer membrane beta-barrel protein [Bacteroidota bacterium]
MKNFIQRNGSLHCLLIFVILIANTFAFAQSPYDRLSSDELFTLAREKAFKQEHSSARQLLRIALNKTPEYTDIRLFLARVYAWDNMFDSSRIELTKVLQTIPNNLEAMSFNIDLEIWDNNPEQALQICNKAVRKFPSSEDLLLKKAQLLHRLKRDDEALVTLAILEDVNPSNSRIREMRESIRADYILQGITVHDTYDNYSNTYRPSHLAYIQYNRSTFIGTVFARLNMRNQNNASGIQGEVDLYPRISNGVYAYLNYGFAGSSSLLFPAHRIGAESFFKLPYAFEGSLGLRYLYFSAGNDVMMYTATVGYYYKDFWFSVRPFIIPSSISFSRSLSLTSRYYYDGRADEFISARIGAGFSPDERNYDPSNKNIYFLTAETYGLGWQQPIGIVSLLLVNVDYTNQELLINPGSFVDLLTVAVGYRYKF